jgi:hypothetical protein
MSVVDTAFLEQMCDVHVTHSGYPSHSPVIGHASTSDIRFNDLNCPRCPNKKSWLPYPQSKQ